MMTGIESMIKMSIAFTHGFFFRIMSVIMMESPEFLGRIFCNIDRSWSSESTVDYDRSLVFKLIHIHDSINATVI